MPVCTFSANGMHSRPARKSSAISAQSPIATPVPAKPWPSPCPASRNAVSAPEPAGPRLPPVATAASHAHPVMDATACGGRGPGSVAAERALQQRRRAHRGQLFIEQLARPQPVVWRIAIDHSCIEPLTAQIHTVLHRGGQLDRHVRPQRLPLHQPWQQPAHHAGRCLELQGGTASPTSRTPCSTRLKICCTRGSQSWPSRVRLRPRA